MTASAFINNLPRGLISPIHGVRISEEDINLDNAMESMGGGGRSPLLEAKDLLQPSSYRVQKSDDHNNEATPSRDSILQLVRLMNLNGNSEAEIIRTQSVLEYSNNDNQVDSRQRSKSDGHLKFFHDFLQDIPPEASKREIESAPEEEVKILNILISEIESNPNYSFAIDSKNICRRSKQLLQNSSWKTRFEVLNLISNLLPKLGPDFDAFLSKLLISVMQNLGHNKEVVGNAAKDLIKLVSLMTKDKKYFVDVLVASGLHNKDSNIRKAVVKNIPNFLNEEFMHLDLFNVIKVLTKVCQKDTRCRKEVERALVHIRYLEGSQGFNKHEMMMSPRSKKQLSELMSSYNTGDSSLIVKSLNDTGEISQEEEGRSARSEEDSQRKRKWFGQINSIISNKISNENSPVLRRQGCKELICLLEEADSLEGLFPHIDTYLSFLSSLRDDPDFTVATTSLRVTSILLHKARVERINRTLPSLVHTVARIFGDDRHVVRSEAAKVFNNLLQKTIPSRVTSILCEDLRNRSSRVREHTLNLLTSALMTFPSDMFDLSLLCQKVVPTLIDPKRRVRQGALENIATIAQGLGSERAYILMKKVLLLEKTEEGGGVTSAVQARLNRRTLPKLTVEGLVEYSLKVYPTQKWGGKEKTSQGLDMEWILKASGSLSNGSICGPTTSSGTNFHGWDQPDLETRDLSSSLPQPLLMSAMRTRSVNYMERKRSYSETTLNQFIPEDRGPLALWSAEPIDLARTAPADFGSYRGVQYLGKLRQGSALSRSVNSEKGFALLPNKYASGGVGSARANERGGLVSPPALSPVPRRLYALEPLDQTDGGSSGLSPPTLTKIPPLRSAAKSGLVAKRIHGSGFDRYNYKDEDEESEDDTLDEEDEEEGDGNEEEECLEEEQIDEAVEVSRKGSSAETRDSGISVLSSNQEEVMEQRAKNSKNSSRVSTTSQIPVRTVANKPEADNCEPEDETTPRNISSEGATEFSSPNQDQEIENSMNHDPIEQELREQSESIGRNSYEALKGGGLAIRGGRSRRGSTNSLPSSLNVRQQNLNIQGKGIATEVSPRGGQRRLYPGGPPTKIPNIKKTNNNNVFNSLEYESDFESDDEDRSSGGNHAMTRMKILKKKRDTMREIERKLTEREAEEAKEQRLKRYKELELRHSGNSLPITRPNSDPEEKSKTHFSRSNSKPSPRPPNLQVSTIPKSRSHDQNLHLKSLTTEPLRPHSLDRSPIINKLPFSRAPTFGRKVGGGEGGNKSNSGGRSPITTTTLPSYFSDPLTSRRSTPGIGFDSGARNTAALSEADIESVAFSSDKNYSTVQGRNFRAYPSPKDALRSGLDLLKSNEWEDQLEGVQSMARLAAFHPEMLTSDLREINALLMKHAKNLRSQVSRTSIQVIMMFFDLLKRAMEPDLDKLVALLLHKTSDTNKFIKEDSNSTLDIIVDNITPSKAVGSIISEGIHHKSPQVRTTVARLLAYSTERYTAAKILNQKEVAEKILPALTKLAQEGSHETRRYAKIAFQRLSTQPNFETVLKKYVSNEELRNIQKVLNNLGSESRGSEDTAKIKGSKGGSLGYRR